MSDRPQRTAWSCAAIALLTLALAACGDVKPSKGHALDMVLYDFSSALRWGNFDKAYDFVDPQTKMEHPLTDLDRSRYAQIEIASYEVMARNNGPNTVDQQIRLSLVNKNTQVGRSIVYQEHWRYDEQIKHWWLVSGLPDLSPQQ